MQKVLGTSNTIIAIQTVNSEICFYHVPFDKVRCEFSIPSTITIKDGEMLNVTAHIIAFPKPEMYWQFGQNGSYVNVSSGLTNSFNTNRQSSNLVKSNLTEEDFGTYSVYAYNGVVYTHVTLFFY
jgi:hypothetical protein